VYEIPIGSNVHNCPPSGYSPEQWREGHGIAPDERVVVFFGLLNRSKGLAELLGAMSELVRDDERVRLVIVGGVAGLNDPANATYELEVRQRIAMLGRCKQRRHIAVAVSRADLLRHLRAPARACSRSSP